MQIRENHRVFALDQRAHGKGRPGREGCPTLTKAVFVDDAISFIANVVGEPAVIVGQSFGGVVAYRVAMARPDLVRALVARFVLVARRSRALVEHRGADTRRSRPNEQRDLCVRLASDGRIFRRR